jgi:XRE family transcriptional regulator, regulator of sulfur utilization
MKLHEQIIVARKGKGLTQEQLADASNLTVRTIQRIESGENIPRSFTLKAIAKALDKPFEYFSESPNQDAEQTADDTSHFLKLLNLSCFTYIVIPYVHFLIPSRLLKKKSGLQQPAVSFARKVIRQQIYWVIALHILLLLTLAYNLGVFAFFHNRDYLINYLWPFFIMYFLNAVIILFNTRKASKVIH